MKLNVNEIIVKKRVRQDLGDMQTLMDSIEEIGLLHPVVVYEKGDEPFLLAGRRRLEAFKKLGRTTVPVTVVKLDDILKAELHENTVRKDFTFSEMCVIDDRFGPEIEKEAKQRMSEGGRGGKLPPLEKPFKVREKMGSYLGFSGKTYEKFQDIKQAVKDHAGFIDIPDRIDKGMSIEYAHKMIINVEQAQSPTPDLPKGQYELVYIDPPWHYDLQLTGAPPYKTMTLEEMKEEIKIPSATNCVLFMWVTNPKLEEALELIRHWGFQYKTNIAWVKKKNDKLQVGTGYYVKGSHELLLIAVKGSPGVPPEASRIPSVVFAERTKTHSEKPKVFYEIIEKMYPAKRKIEMFARNKRKGWKAWGDSVDEQ